jgi:hypothetical protein
MRIIIVCLLYDAYISHFLSQEAGINFQRVFVVKLMGKLVPN